MVDIPSVGTFATAYEGAAIIYADLFAQMLSIVQPVETRPFEFGIWQHFPHGRKERETTDQFYVLQGDPEGVLAAIDAIGVGHLPSIDVLGPEPVQDHPVYEAAGFRGDGIEVLMDRVLGENDRSLSDEPLVIRSLTEHQIEKLAQAWNGGRAANGYQPIEPVHNTTPGLVQAYIEIDGEPAAYGRGIVHGTDAFIADINAFPGFRHRGLGRSIMHSLHRDLARAGATRIVLTGTNAGLPLYARLGYRALALDWTYVTASQPASLCGEL